MEEELKTGNLSKAKREKLIVELGAIKAFLEKHAGSDKNATRLLSFAADLEKEVREKKFGLVFEEHRERVDAELEENIPVLEDVKKRFVGPRGGAAARSPNFLIEGDNLAALKLLEKTHRGRIDLIYIDPPYNTGNTDFVYNDSFVALTDTFRHSKWLSFMRKRLEIAQRLLSSKGVIFISIDDNEQAALKLLCDDIFGPENFLNVITVRRRIKSLNTQFASQGLASFNVGCEYILVYAKTRRFKFKALRAEKDANKKSSKGKWQGFWSNADRPTMRYEILGFTPKTGQWRNRKELADIAVENYKQFLLVQDKYESLEDYSEKTGIKEFIRRDPKGKGKNGGVYHWEAPDDTTMRTSSWMDIEVSQIQKVFEDLKFDNPKSIRLMEEIVKTPFETPSIILDFFAGSGTTGHAVMKLNAEDNGHRRFILVTNNENGICEKVTYERLKRVIEKEGYAERVKYFRVGYVPILEEEGYWERADSLLKHVRELVELENGIDFARDKSVAIVLTDGELATFVRSLSAKDADVPRILYKGHNVLIGTKAKAALNRRYVEVRTIPDYYYPELED